MRLNNRKLGFLFTVLFFVVSTEFIILKSEEKLAHFNFEHATPSSLSKYYKARDIDVSERDFRE